jgi:hypothetical protein
MQPTKQLVDAIYWERVKRARQMSPEDKLLAGLVLFELTSGIMADGIRSQFPDADTQRVQEILNERLALSRRLEEKRDSQRSDGGSH